MNKLSKRMQAVAALVRNTTCLADVGCDHGYVPIYLIQSECIGHAIAMDVNRGTSSGRGAYPGSSFRRLHRNQIVRWTYGTGSI